MDVIRSAKTFLSFSLLLSVTNICYAEDIIYRWVDKNNIVHFSQHPPAHNNFTTMNLSSSGKKQLSVTKANLAQDQQFHQEVKEINKVDEQKAIQATMEKRCEEARKNIRTLLAFDKVKYTASDGKVKVLSDSEKNQQLVLSEKQIEVYCSAQE